MLHRFKNKQSVKIACAVTTDKSRRENLRAAFAAWGQHCDYFIPISNEDGIDEIGEFDLIDIDFTHHPPGYPVIIELIRRIYHVMHSPYETKFDFDFLTISNEDSFWIIENLKHFLSKYEKPREYPYYIGRKIALNGDVHRIYNHQAGYVLSTKTIETIAENCRSYPAISQDVHLSDCLSSHAVRAVDSRENGRYGAEVFHIYDAAKSGRMDYEKDDFLRLSMGVLGHAKLEGIEGVSKSSVLFGGVVGREQIGYHNRLYAHPRHGVAKPAFSSKLKTPIIMLFVTLSIFLILAVIYVMNLFFPWMKDVIFVYCGRDRISRTQPARRRLREYTVT